MWGGGEKSERQEGGLVLCRSRSVQMVRSALHLVQVGDCFWVGNDVAISIHPIESRAAWMEARQFVDRRSLGVSNTAHHQQSTAQRRAQQNNQ